MTKRRLILGDKYPKAAVSQWALATAPQMAPQSEGQHTHSREEEKKKRTNHLPRVWAHTQTTSLRRGAQTRIVPSTLQTRVGAQSPGGKCRAAHRWSMYPASYQMFTAAPAPTYPLTLIFNISESSGKFCEHFLSSL